jgi:hypothetical protein
MAPPPNDKEPGSDAKSKPIDPRLAPLLEFSARKPK